MSELTTTVVIAEGGTTTVTVAISFNGLARECTT